MPLASGRRWGRMKSSNRWAGGGMGEVYKARDTRLDRMVAIKVLPASFAADSERRERFEAGGACGVLAEPSSHLRAVRRRQSGRRRVSRHGAARRRIARRTVVRMGRFPLDQALRFGIEIADALSKAHSQGHCPSRSQARQCGDHRQGAKLLDFGLAKSTGPVKAGHYPDAGSVRLPPGGESRPDFSAGADHAPNLTAQGTILGTFQYMSPRAARGTRRGRAVRHLRVRRAALRDDDRPQGLRGQESGEPHRFDHVGLAAADRVRFSR